MKWCSLLIAVAASAKRCRSYASEVASALDTGTCDHLYVVYADDGVRHVNEFLPGDLFKCKTLGHGGTDFRGSFEWLRKMHLTQNVPFI